MKSKHTDYDYYKILGVDKSASILDIKKKYRSLLAKFHPDKLKNLSSAESDTKAEQYLLIRTAGEILTNQDKKKFYDIERKVNFNKDFLNQKQSFEEFLSLQNLENTAEKKSLAQIEFIKNCNETNLQKGYRPELLEKLDVHDMQSHIVDLNAQRESEEIEFTKSNIFNGEEFDKDKFNELFTQAKIKEDRLIKKQIEKGEIMVYDDKFTAYNDINTNNYIGVNDDYGNLYSNDNFKDTNLFTKMHNNTNNFNLDSGSSSEEEVEEITYTVPIADTKLTKLTEQDFERILNERRMFENTVSTMTINDYKSPLDDQFSISRDFM